MKNCKVLTIIASCLLAALSFTACNNMESSDNSITPAERQQANKAIKGNYHGQVLRSQKNAVTGEIEKDSLEVDWEIANDSVMHIFNFPSKFIAENITDSIIKKAIEQQTPQAMKCYIGLAQVNPIAFLINPMGPAYTINYGGKDHKIQIAFLINSTSSYGVYDESKKLLQMQLVKGGVYVDGTLQSTLMPTSTAYIFKATKQ